MERIWGKVQRDQEASVTTPQSKLYNGTSGVFHTLTCTRAIFNIQLPPEIISLILGKIMILKCVKNLIFKTKKCIQTLEENTGRTQQAVGRSGYKPKPAKS